MNSLQHQANANAISITTINQQLQDLEALPQKDALYSAQIHRKQPTAFVFLIDQSGSMAESIERPDGSKISKAQLACEVINDTLNTLLIRAVKGNDVRLYYDIALIGYGAEEQAQLLWSGALKGKTWVTMQELQDCFLEKISVQETKLVRGTPITNTIEKKIWLKPLAKGLTPMNSALTLAETLLKEWIVDGHLNSYPPTIINITDGEATDAKAPQLLERSNALKQLKTTDGACLFFNVHISNAKGEMVIFPHEKAELPNDKYAHLLYDMSSLIPEAYHLELVKYKQIDHSLNYVAMSFNGSASQLITMMNIGTSQASKLTSDPQ